MTFRSVDELEPLIQQRTRELQLLTEQLKREVQRREAIAADLQRQTEQLRLVLKAGGMGTWDWDLVTDMALLDDTEIKLTGISANNGLIPAQEFFGRVHPDDRAGLERAIREAIEERQEFNHEFRVRIADGTYRWLAGRGTVDFDENGAPLRMRGVNFDVTERKLAEEKVRNSEHRLRRVLDSLSVFVAVLKPDGTVVKINRAPLETAQIELSEVAGKKFWQTVWWSHSPKLQKRLRDAVLSARSGARVRYDASVQVPGGRPVTLDFMVVPVRNSKGDVVELVASGLDVTDRIVAERALQESEAFLRSVLESSADCIEVLDLDGRLLAMNRPGLKAMEIENLQLVRGTDWRARWSPDSRQLVEEAIQDARSGSVGRFQDTCATAKGTRKFWDVIVTAIMRPDGKPDRLLSIARDITSRMQAEEELRLRLRAIEFATNGIVISDARVKGCPIIYVNPAFEELTGYTADEVAGKNFRFLTGPDSDPQGIDAMREAIRSGQERHVTILNYRKDGSRFWNDVHISPVEDPHGNITHFVQVQSDATARVRHELRLKEAQEAADAASRAKSEFLANMSHEIRTPLTAILGCADSLYRQIDDPQPRDAVKMIKDQGELLLGILNDVLDLSKIEAGKLEIHTEPCYLASIISNVESLMKTQAVERGLQLTTEYLTRIPEIVQTDPLRLRQILLNLVSNAVKFTEQGTVRIEVACDREANLKIAVADTGIGIAPTRLNSIFDAFTQERSRLSSRAGGTGLGLQICQRLAQMLGGSITVESTVGQGSRFTLQLPLPDFDPDALKDPGDVSEAAELRESSASIDVFVPCRVLIVEDMRAIQFMMSRMLQDVVRKVDVVSNGREAVELVQSVSSSGEAYDIILMDVQMPVMNGFDATRLLRKMGIAVPIIALTAAAMAGDREKCIDAGCTDYLSKPVDRSELIASLQRHYNNSSAE